MKPRHLLSVAAVALSLGLSGCSTLCSICTFSETKTETKKEEEKKPELRLKAASFSDLKGWREDDPRGALDAFHRSCAVFEKKSAESAVSPALPNNVAGFYKDWQELCRATTYLFEPDGETVRQFFESWFTPYQVSSDDEVEGLFTGYYESALNGSYTKSDVYKYPLHLRPDDLVMVYLGKFRDELKGHRIAGRVVDGQLIPYETRADIIDGQMRHDDDYEFVYLDSPVDAFFLHIQGSGRINMDDGSTLRVGYAGQNGHPYYAIGRELIKRGHLTKENVSLQTIRAWLEENPDQADEIMNTNKSYVFFRKLEGPGPIGAQNVALTEGRSLAVDRSLIPFGLPVYLNAEAPMEGEESVQRLLIAQDTGGAIRGAVRGDVFWGYGDKAEALAGHMKSKGQYWLLLPKNRTDISAD